MGAGGKEALLDIGQHCEHFGCHQLDFLPFTCDGCQMVFCLEHRTHKSHQCPETKINSRKVIICERCSQSIEITGKDNQEEINKMVEQHEKSKDCDPSKKKKPKCPVPRCKQELMISNHTTCKTCQIKVCLAHRLPADHACKGSVSSYVKGGKGTAVGNKFLIALAGRNAKDCGTSSNKSSPRSSNKSSSQVPIC